MWVPPIGETVARGRAVSDCGEGRASARLEWAGQDSRPTGEEEGRESWAKWGKKGEVDWGQPKEEK